MSIAPETARAWVDVDLAALVANAKTIAALSQSRLLPMVKANAYGLGAVPVSRALESVDPWGYGVATIEEGAELRRAGITRPILVFTPFQPGQAPLFQGHQLRPVLADLSALQDWTTATSAAFHLEIDTGMARSGFRWDDNACLSAAAGILAAAAGWEGIFTHFHSGDSSSATEMQWRRFQAVVASLPRRPRLVHAASSAQAVRGATYAGDLVRPGMFLYGGDVGGEPPRVVARLHSRVVALRMLAPGDTVGYGATWSASGPTRVATIAIGYGDGLPRSLSNRGRIELRGRVAPIIGRVAMDMTMLAVASEVAIGDVATVFGGLISLDSQAELAGTISYELLTSIGARVTRRYHPEP